MEDQRFDGVARALAGLGTTRRSLLPGIAGSVAAMLVRGGETAAARCVAPGKKCRTKTGKQPCCGGAKCQGPKCKCPPGRPKCGPKCCAKGQRCQNRRCVATKPNPGCTGDVCAKGCAYDNLEDAIAAAPPQSTIKVCPGTYQTSELTIARSLTLEGASASTTVVAGVNAIRVFSISAAATVTLRNLTISGGRGGTGAGIFNQGTLTLHGVTVTGNTSQRTAPADGAGIANFGGTLHLIQSRVTQNVSAGGQGGGIYNGGGGEVTLTNSTVVDNEAVTGGGITNRDGKVTLDASSVTGNKAGGGGGISNGGELIVTNRSKVDDNTAEGFAGGGIANGTSGSVTIEGNSSVSANKGSIGGGINNNGGQVTLDQSEMTLNQATEGAGIYNGGGGFWLDGGTMTANTATGRGGAIFNDSGSVRGINQSSITANGAGGAGGGGIYNQLGAAEVELNSVAGNSPNNCRPQDSVTNCPE
jgi:hypothetical protein